MLAPSEVCVGASFHPDQARWQAAENADHLTATELTADQNLSYPINAVDLKDLLGDVEANRGDLHWSGSLSGAEAITPPS